MSYRNFTPVIKLVILLVLLHSTAQASDSKQESQPDTSKQNIAATRDPELIMDQLQSNLLELKTILSQPAPDKIIVKTKTAHIHHLLSELTTWSDQEDTVLHPELPAAFLITIHNMLQEVDRDDMLDSAELQILLSLYPQAERYLQNQARSP
jgi:hypothetical protein